MLIRDQTWFDTRLDRAHCSGVELQTLHKENLVSNPVVLKNGHVFHMNEYLAIDSGKYVYKQPSLINSSMWMDAFQRR